MVVCVWRDAAHEKDLQFFLFAGIVRSYFYTETRTWLGLVCTGAERGSDGVEVSQTGTDSVSMYYEWKAHICVSDKILMHFEQ